MYLFISRFGFKSGFCRLIAQVPVHCFSFTLSKSLNTITCFNYNEIELINAFLKTRMLTYVCMWPYVKEQIISRVIRKPDFAYAKTKAQMISAFVFAL